VQERYQALDWPQQLGNLARPWRISTRASSPQYDALVTDYCVAALLVDWSADHPRQLLAGLAICSVKRCLAASLAA
jgi:hypothetical protein